MNRAIFAASALALAAALVPPATALACGDGVSPTYAPSFRIDPNRTIAVQFDEGVERYVFDVRFCGAPDDFGLILPIPNAPTSPPRMSPVSFRELARRTLPIISCSEGGCGGLGASADDGTVYGDAGIEVVGTGEVSVFDYVILSARDVSTLEDWLRANDYVFNPKAHDIYQSYVERGWVFVAFKINATSIGQPNPRDDDDGDDAPFDAGMQADASVDADAQADASVDASTQADASDDANTQADASVDAGNSDAGVQDADSGVEPKRVGPLDGDRIVQPPSTSTCGQFGPLELTFPSDKLVIPTRILGASSHEHQKWHVFTAGAQQFLPSESSPHRAEVTYSEKVHYWGCDYYYDDAGTHYPPENHYEKYFRSKYGHAQDIDVCGDRRDHDDLPSTPCTCHSAEAVPPPEELASASGQRLTALNVDVDPTADEDLVLDRLADGDVGTTCPEKDSSSSCNTGGGPTNRTLGTLLLATMTAFIVRGRKRRRR